MPAGRHRRRSDGHADSGARRASPELAIKRRAKSGVMSSTQESGGRSARSHQQLNVTEAVSEAVSGPRTCNVTFCDEVPWPWPWTATVTYTECCPDTTDWLSGCGACPGGCGWEAP